MFPRFLQALLKNETKRVGEIILNYFKTRPTWGPRNPFKLFQKPDTRDPRDYFKLLQKSHTRSPRDVFKLLQKKPKWSLRFLSNYFKSKTHSGFPRFFQTTAKSRQGVPEILSNFFLQKLFFCF